MKFAKLLRTGWCLNRNSKIETQNSRRASDPAQTREFRFSSFVIRVMLENCSRVFAGVLPGGDGDFIKFV
jgi:hypothetical protein